MSSINTRPSHTSRKQCTRKYHWLALCALMAAMGPAAAQVKTDAAGSYPSRPVRWVVGFAAGASNDVVARTIGARLAATWGQQVVVDNRTGAAGMIGAEIVSRSAPDGYTLLLSTAGPNVNGPLLALKSPYKVEDFTQIIVFAYTPHIIVTYPGFAPKTAKELADYMRANPGRTNWGSSGLNGSTHIGLAIFEAAAGVRANHIPYKGAAVGLIDVMSGQIQGMHTTLSSAEAQVRSNRVRVLGVAAPKRLQALPDVPTLAESGVKNAESLVWFGMAAPLKMPPAIVAKLNADSNAALANPEVEKRFTDLGLVIVGGSPADAASFVNGEASRIRKLLEAGVLQKSE